MTQLPLTLPPAHSPSDPSTSAQAAREYTASGARQRGIDRAVELVRQWPGLTALELATRAGVDRHELQKRLSDANHPRVWLVEQGPKRNCTVSGKRAVTWWRP